MNIHDIVDGIVAEAERPWLSTSASLIIARRKRMLFPYHCIARLN